jgi:hypothetical protein
VRIQVWIPLYTQIASYKQVLSTKEIVSYT